MYLTTYFFIYLFIYWFIYLSILFWQLNTRLSLYVSRKECHAGMRRSLTNVITTVSILSRMCWTTFNCSTSEEVRQRSEPKVSNEESSTTKAEVLLTPLDNNVGDAEVVRLRLWYHEGKEKKGKNLNNSCTFYFSLPSFHGDVFSRLYTRVHSTETSASLSRSLATSPRWWAMRSGANERWACHASNTAGRMRNNSQVQLYLYKQ